MSQAESQGRKRRRYPSGAPWKRRLCGGRYPAAGLGSGFASRRRGSRMQRQIVAKAEPHYYTGNLATTFTDICAAAAAQRVDPIALLAQGDDIVDRDGRKIWVKSLTIRGFLHVDDEDADLRMVIYSSLTSYSINIGLADFLTPLRRNNLYQVYFDKGYRLTTDDVWGSIPINLYLPINRYYTFQSAAAGSNTDALYIHCTSDRLVGHGPTFVGFYSITFFG